MPATTPFSILDLAILRDGHDAADAYSRSLDLARHAERWGYQRFWLAEHHNMPHVGSAAPTILMGYIAQGTERIRVGSGGIMLPNHSPLMVAEQIGTLARLYPDRIDLGLGRAPGTDQQTAAVLRRGRTETVQEFPQDLEELQQYFSADNLDAPVRAYPAEGIRVPIYLLGSSMDSAYLASSRGLPYVFASHFAPGYFQQATSYYQHHFKPSPRVKKPYIMACVNVVAADTDEEARYLASSFYQMALGIIRRKSYPLLPPVEDMDQIWSVQEAAALQQMMQYSFIGSQDTVSADLEKFINLHKVDELMVTTNLYDHKKRLHSFELTANAIQSFQVAHRVNNPV
ncbi:luciferase family oxidoreductase, group 1 [Cyclobacterium lianum]|uniref:Luciferase-like monooxygenase n=1 Tax=Cyclobacterium lianum TaxID=388280 RepID=A0A1M7P7J5_9BACT|nr:LLM class flavin-dependent oxidoreductase [Cyclobacterium lianum]SHN12689.1 luciferase family oxidoreductase, group 1 [Cyclobacterium lianum]